jgi:hypothetical protein
MILRVRLKYDRIKQILVFKEEILTLLEQLIKEHLKEKYGDFTLE